VALPRIAQSPAVDKKTFLLAIPVFLSGLIVFWNLTGLGLSHWDEYNYIETAKWFLRLPGGTFTIYEPPGFPFLLALFFRLFGVKDYVAIAVSGVFAVATVALVAYIGLKLFGLQVGLTAPIMLLIMPLFITYSRMALTDIAFTFFFSLAIVSMYAAVRSPRPRNVGFAGLALGACVMIKYNGFMPLIVFAIYLLIAIRSMKAGERFRSALCQLRTLILMIVPSAVLGLLFVAFLGLSTELSDNQLLSPHALKLMTISAPTILADGFAKFSKAAVSYHSAQVGFFPLIAAAYYAQVLVYFVPIPVLIIAILGLLRKDIHDGPELFLDVWLLGILFLIASIPAQYSRAILPALPPLGLCASLGLTRLSAFAQSLSMRWRPRIRLKTLTPLLLILVVALSLPGILQAVSVQHHGYRDAAMILVTAGAHGPVLADSQLVIGFYHPVNFGEINDTNLAKNHYLVVDFIAAENGNGPTIQNLTKDGRLKLLATIPADLPPEVYLDSMTFTQLAQWNYTYIQVYEIANATSSTPWPSTTVALIDLPMPRGLRLPRDYSALLPQPVAVPRYVVFYSCRRPIERFPRFLQIIEHQLAVLQVAHEFHFWNRLVNTVPSYDDYAIKILQVVRKIEGVSTRQFLDLFRGVVGIVNSNLHSSPQKLLRDPKRRAEYMNLQIPLVRQPENTNIPEPSIRDSIGNNLRKTTICRNRIFQKSEIFRSLGPL
jgi:4-amino-4-deoxy-L-arabinose transferase-like glycosyltransferase